MLRDLLLPNKCKKVGWFILIPAAIVGVVLMLLEFDSFQVHSTVFAVFSNGLFEGTHYFNFVETNIVPSLVGVLFIVGGVMVGFSKEKNEDEFISKLRLSSLLWAVLVNYALLLFAFIFIYGLFFLNVMMYNMFTILVVFIVRFNYILYRNTRSLSHGE